MVKKALIKKQAQKGSKSSSNPLGFKESTGKSSQITKVVASKSKSTPKQSKQTNSDNLNLYGKICKMADLMSALESKSGLDL